MGWCIMYIRIKCSCIFVPLFLHFSFSPIFKRWHFSSHFSLELSRLEGWNLVHAWTVDRCIVYFEIRLMLLSGPFIFHLSFSPIFKLKIFRHTFLQNCEALKVETCYIRGKWVAVSCIPESCYCSFSPLHFFYFSFSSIIKHLKFSSHFSQGLWDLEHWNLIHVHTWTVGRCIVYTGIRLQLHICPFISSFFFLSNFLRLIFCHIFLRNCEA